MIDPMEAREIGKSKMKYFNQGFALCLAEFLRDSPVSNQRTAQDTFDAAGLSFEELEESEVDDYDLNEIKEHIKDKEIK